MLRRIVSCTKLVRWLVELLKQPATLGIIAFLAVFVGVIAYLYPRAATERSIVVSEYVVCESEYEKDCGPHNAYVYCSANTDEKAAKACKRYSQKGDPELHSGAKCGANLYTYLCINDQP
jgi:hypothetical protein